MATNVIGISAHFHDSSCCLIQDGKLIWAAEEERFSRKKHDASIPGMAFRACLTQNNLLLTNVDCLAYYEDPIKKLARQIYMAQLPETSRDMKQRILANLKRAGNVERSIRQCLGYDGPIKFFDHHKSHAASAFYFSGFQESAVLTIDGVGEFATTTLASGDSNGINTVEEVRFPHSLGLLYSTFTSYLGFKINNGEYKVMGLAPYGEPRYVDKIRFLISTEKDGLFRLNMEYFDYLTTDQRMYSDRFIELFGVPPREPESELLPFHKDIASSIQLVLEEVLLETVHYLYDKVPSENLCMSGGVALNCVANGRILREGPFKRLFVQPASNDAGGALGAAALAHRELVGEPVCAERQESSLLGPSYSSAEIGKMLEKSLPAALDYRGDQEALLEAVVDRLEEGKVIGWMHGRMEFGPRALGARSFLADPRVEDMRDRINALVKKREGFRPFAPAVLLEEAQNHFDLDHPSPFMLETCQVTSKFNLPAITHVNGSARVQTVDRKNGGRFYDLLRTFFKRTGCPLLLNTSFNMRGEPVVCDPLDAIKCFVRSEFDVLVLEDFIIDHDSMPSAWSILSQPRPSDIVSEFVGDEVYRLL